MAQADITFRIRTVDEDKEITISVPLDATFEDVAQQVGASCAPWSCPSPCNPALPVLTCSALGSLQVREQKGWGDDTVVRLLCGGRELQPSQGVAGASSTVLHCVGTSGTLVRPADRSSYESKDSVADLQQDWVSGPPQRQLYCAMLWQTLGRIDGKEGQAGANCGAPAVEQLTEQQQLHTAAEAITARIRLLLQGSAHVQ
jgi:hypothetical protein